MTARRVGTEPRRRLSLREHVLATIGPSVPALLRRGASLAEADEELAAWRTWDAEHGFAWRVGAGIPARRDRERLADAEEPGDYDPPDPPGFDLV